ncbi:hypothetical protein ACR0Q7_09930 [Enterococcus faecalis]|uniref:hypothetical protein n=1 Tax=Enterococcus faecalis TaxID=1351 RepID=UPI003D957E33
MTKLKTISRMNKKDGDKRRVRQTVSGMLKAQLQEQSVQEYSERENKPDQRASAKAGAGCLSEDSGRCSQRQAEAWQKTTEQWATDVKAERTKKSVATS